MFKDNNMTNENSLHPNYETIALSTTSSDRLVVLKGNEFVFEIKKINIYQEKENLWSCAYSTNSDMIPLINYLYKDATIYLTRKKEKCDLIYKEFLKYQSNSLTT